MVTQLEQIADDLRDASILDRRVSGERLDGAADPVVAGLRDLAGAVREHRAPGATPLPETGILAPAGSGVAGVRRLITGLAA